MSEWTTVYRNEQDEILTTAQVANEDFEELKSSTTHNGCGGLVFHSDIGTAHYRECQACGAKWQDTFSGTGWVRLEAYGGKGI